MSAHEPWWWSALTPADTKPLLSLREVMLLLDARSVPHLAGELSLDVPVYSALRVAEIIAARESERRLEAAREER